MAAAENHVRLAMNLPPRLLRFFAKFPPAQLQSTNSPLPPSPPSQTVSIADNTSPSDPNATPSTTVPISPGTGQPSDTSAPGPSRSKNPFLPFKNPRTGNWHAPAYSLRRQAELYKLAAAHHVLPLMPIAHKHPEVREQRRLENGLRVQGTGVGKRVKGKAWERTLHARLRERQSALEGMPLMIRQWKERGHGRWWKKWPK